MDLTPRKQSLDPDRAIPWFSCAFCRSAAEKPFKVCESCGKEQPEPTENGDR